MTILKIPSSSNWRGVCPHCGQATFLPCQHEFGNEAGSHFLLVCPNCLKSLVVIEQGHVITTYPSGHPPVIDESLAGHIRADYEEASKCYNAGLHIAAAIMCRRLIELSAKEKGAEGRNLYERIESLVEAGVLTSELGKVAHRIRIIGNNGAHPDYPDLIGLGQKDAEEALEFVKIYTDYVYVLPAKTSILETD